MKCIHLETEEYGDICHAGKGDECPHPFDCPALYDVHGRHLQEDMSGLDIETYGFY